MSFSVLDSSGATKVTGGSGSTTVVSSTSTGTQNDFAPGISGNTLVRLNNASSLTITGLANGVDGQRVTFVSIGAGQVNFSHQAAGSSAGNRLINNVSSIDTSLAAGKGRATYDYDATTARWRLIQHDQGAPISYTPTWTGSVSNPALGNAAIACNYVLYGKEIYVALLIIMGSTTTFGSGFWQFSVPGTVSSGPVPTAAAFGYDNSSGTPGNIFAATYSGFGSGGLINYTSTGANVDATTPFTWAVNDQYRFTGLLEIN